MNWHAVLHDANGHVAPAEVRDLNLDPPPVPAREDDESQRRRAQIEKRVTSDMAAAQEAAAVLVEQLGLDAAAVQIQGDETTVQVTVSRVAAQPRGASTAKIPATPKKAT